MKQMENRNDMMMLKMKQNEANVLFHMAEKLTTNSMDTALNKIDCIFAVFLTSVTM